MESQDVVVFGLSANKELVKDVCSYLSIEQSPISVEHFKDGEILVELDCSVRGKKVFVVQSTCYPVTENLMELLVAIDAIKRASAQEITCIIPYYGYARQDRKAKPRQPITAKLVADLLASAGANRVVTCDIHAAQIQGFFNFPMDDLSCTPMLGKYFKEKFINKDDVVVVSPDHGGTTRARKLAEILNVPIAIVDKRRPRANECEATAVIGDVKDKDVVIVDDICDTAGSLVAASNILKQYGCKDIYVSIVHGIFSSDALLKIENSPIKEIVITDTIPLTLEKANMTNKVTVLPIAKMISAIITSISDHKPMSVIYEHLFKNN